MFDIAAGKQELRRRMHEARDALASEFRMAAAAALADKSSFPGFRRLLPAPGGMIAGYMPIKSEIDPRPLMRKLEDEGFRLALPCVNGNELTFHEYASGDPLVEGRFHTFGPEPDRPVVAPETLLVPILAFDHRGTRLGYGRGYYDRALAALPEAKRIGVGFAMQQLPAVPFELHDAMLDAIFTEQ
jgi:5-formyltetrahydrofolate cyclo-ligase